MHRLGELLSISEAAQMPDEEGQFHVYYRVDWNESEQLGK
jgi:hypothetical protein